MKIAAFFALLVSLTISAMAEPAPIALVPLDDRPVTRQLPQMLGAIAGTSVLEPPRPLLGNYLTPGQSDNIIAWLNTGERRRAGAFVISSDMLAYGGLVASRIPATRYADAVNRLREITYLKGRHPRTPMNVFGTVMRLAPTGIPALGEAQKFFAPFPAWQYLQQYANLHDPPLPAEEATAARLRESIGAPTLQAYWDTRARNLAVDLALIHMTAAHSIDRLVLGQDDAGPVGLHLRDVAALREAVIQSGVPAAVSVEPGADELGISLVARALARGSGWTPRIAVRYSPPKGAAYGDPLEFAPISVAINSLVDLCGGVLDDSAPDLTLFVRVPGETPAQDDVLLTEMRDTISAGHSTVFADLTFLEHSFASQERFVRSLLASGVASKLDAYSSWNTNANTVGTALAEGIAAGVGRRNHRYDPRKHAELTFDRIADDYLFHAHVRPDLNAWLDRQGVTDHTYLLPDVALAVSQRNNAQLWNAAADLLRELYPQYHIAAIRITLPWARTFETEIDAALAPNL